MKILLTIIGVALGMIQTVAFAAEEPAWSLEGRSITVDSSTPDRPSRVHADTSGSRASQLEAVQGILERVRRIIRKAVPGVEEVISYKIPTYKLLGDPVLNGLLWRAH
jgi:hypothetical protein